MIKIGDIVRVRVNIEGTLGFAGLIGKVVDITINHNKPEFNIYEIFIEDTRKYVNFYGYKLEKIGSLDIKISI